MRIAQNLQASHCDHYAKLSHDQHLKKKKKQEQIVKKIIQRNKSENNICLKTKRRQGMKIQEKGKKRIQKIVKERKHQNGNEHSTNILRHLKKQGNNNNK